MEYLLLASLTLLTTGATAADTPCPAGYIVGQQWCAQDGGPSNILFCTAKNTTVAIENCPGKCTTVGDSVSCLYRGLDDKCDNPGGPYNVWCEKDGGPSGIKVCLKDGTFPVVSECKGVCESNGGHAVCLPAGWNDPCPKGTYPGPRYCDFEGSPSPVRYCNEQNRFLVEYNCTGICDSRHGSAQCYEPLS